MFAFFLRGMCVWLIFLLSSGNYAYANQTNIVGDPVDHPSFIDASVPFPPPHPSAAAAEPTDANMLPPLHISFDSAAASSLTQPPTLQLQLCVYNVAGDEVVLEDMLGLVQVTLTEKDWCLDDQIDLTLPLQSTNNKTTGTVRVRGVFLYAQNQTDDA